MRLLTAIAVALSLLPWTAAAEEYRDAIARYRLTIPADWQKSTELTTKDGTAWVSPRALQTFGFCLVSSSAIAETEETTQADINARLSGRFTAAFWLETFNQMTDVKLEDSGEEPRDDRTLYYAVANYDESGIRTKFKTMMHVVPGRIHTVFCASKVDGYAREDTDFETVFDTFTPTADEIIAAGPSPNRPVFAARPAEPGDPQGIRRLNREAAGKAQQLLRQLKTGRR